MADGNLSRILVWVSDTILVKKQLAELPARLKGKDAEREGGTLCYVADAATGTPIADAKVEFFGWYSMQVKLGKNEFKIVTQEFSETSDKDGQVIVSSKKLSDQYQWLIIATQARAKGESARFAYLGFSYWADPHSRAYLAFSND